jgi:CTP synthase
VVRWARENDLPFFGICLGLQVAIIEFARNVCRLPESNSTEFTPECGTPVIALMQSQREVADLGGTMRLGAYTARLRPGSRAAQTYGVAEISERHRHRWEVNNAYRDVLAEYGSAPAANSPTCSIRSSEARAFRMQAVSTRSRKARGWASASGRPPSATFTCRALLHRQATSSTWR